MSIIDISGTRQRRVSDIAMNRFTRITALAGGDPVADKGYAISMVSTSFIQLQYGVISGVRVSTFTRWVDTV